MSGTGLPIAAVVARLTTFAGVSLIAFVVAPAILYPFFRAASAVTGTRFIAYGAMSCVAMLVGTALTVRWFGESWRDTTRLGADTLRGWPLLGGLAAGWFAVVVPCGLMIWLGALRIETAEGGNWWQAAGLALVALAPAALTEELAFRGYAFTLIRRAWGAGAAVVVTSVAFALLHLLNPGVTVQAIAMVAVAGAFLALVRLAFDSLWAAWLAHVAFNFVQVAVFHTAVSGFALPQPSYRTVPVGGDWITGGAWGPEAGVSAALGMLGVSFLLAVRAGWIRIHRRGWRIAIEMRPGGRRES